LFAVCMSAFFRWSGGRKPETNNTGHPLVEKVQNRD